MREAVGRKGILEKRPAAFTAGSDLESQCLGNLAQAPVKSEESHALLALRCIESARHVQQVCASQVADVEHYVDLPGERTTGKDPFDTG